MRKAARNIAFFLLSAAYAALVCAWTVEHVIMPAVCFGPDVVKSAGQHSSPPRVPVFVQHRHIPLSSHQCFDLAEPFSSDCDFGNEWCVRPCDQPDPPVFESSYYSSLCNKAPPLA